MISSSIRMIGLVAAVALALGGAAAAAPHDQVSDDGKVTGPAPTAPGTFFKAKIGSAKPPSADGARAIYGGDDRDLVKNTREYPARATVLITFEQEGKLARCTGFLASDDTVITAGRCLHGGGDKGEWTKRSSVRVYPGANGYKDSKVLAPFGACRAKRLLSTVGWVEEKEEDFDYGAIQLTCRIGNRVGWYGAAIADKAIKDKVVQAFGYPGDFRYTMAAVSGKVRNVNDTYLVHRLDTTGGMEGGALWRTLSGCGRCAYAIVTNRSSDEAEGNLAIRITRDVFNNLAAWSQ